MFLMRLASMCFEKSLLILQSSHRFSTFADEKYESDEAMLKEMLETVESSLHALRQGPDASRLEAMEALWCKDGWGTLCTTYKVPISGPHAILEWFYKHVNHQEMEEDEGDIGGVRSVRSM